MQTELGQDAIKKLFKEALTETLRDERELLHEVFADVVEDMMLIKAIQEGQQTEEATRETIFHVLEVKE